MKMEVRGLKRAAMLAEWKERIVVCRRSGMSVTQWCREQGISSKTYYRWERAVLAEAGQQLVVQTQKDDPVFVEVSMTQKADRSRNTEGTVVARLHTAMGDMDVYAGADMETLRAIIGALKDAE